MRNFPSTLRRILALVVFGLTATWGMRSVFAGPLSLGPKKDAASAMPAHAVSRESGGEADALESASQEERETWKVKVDGLPFDPVPRDGEHTAKCPAVVYELVGRDGRSVREFGFVEEGVLELPVRSSIAGEEVEVAEVRAVGASANGERSRPVHGFESVRPRGDGERVLRFELAPKTQLIVKDAETGEPLEGVEIRFLRSDDPGARYPWSNTRLGDGVLGIWQACERQPIELEPLVPPTRGLSGRVELRVRAVGRAERQIAVRLGTGGTHEILLQRAGLARFTWHVPADLEELGYRSEVPLALRLETESTDAAAPAAAVDFELLPFRFVDSESLSFGQVELDRVRWADVAGLTPGAYIAQFELPRHVLLRATPLARATFTVESGRMTNVELETVMEQDARPSRLAFELDIPAELGAAPQCRLEVRAYGDSPDPSGLRAPSLYLSSRSDFNVSAVLDYDRESRRSSSFLVSKGECELAISGDLEYRVRLEVGADTDESRKISIPSPTRIRVRFVSDDLRGEDLPQALRWLARFETGPSRNFVTFGAAGQPGVFELSPLSDRIELDCPPRVAFESTAARTLQFEGAGEHEVRIVPLPLLRIRLSLDGRPHSVPPEFAFGFVRADAEDEPLRPTTDLSGSSQLRARHEGGEYEQRIWFPQPGEYRLRIAKLDGFRPFPPQTVTLAARGDSVLELQLVRERGSARSTLPHEPPSLERHMRNFPFSLRWWMPMALVAACAVGSGTKRREAPEPPQVATSAIFNAIASLEEVPSADAGHARVATELGRDPASSQPARPGTGVRWSGRITFVGPEPPRDSFDLWKVAEGELHLDFADLGGERTRVVSTIKDGRWSCRLPFVADDIVDVKVAGVVRRERLWRSRPGFENLPFELSSTPAIEVEAAPVTVLRVVDDESGAPIHPFFFGFHEEHESSPLADVEQDWGRVWEDETLELHPRNTWFLTPNTKHVASVGAAGYVAGSVGFVLGSGETHVVRLRAAGSAKLSWSLAYQPDISEEELFSDSMELTVEATDGRRAATLDGLVRSRRYSYFDFDMNDGTPFGMGRDPEPVAILEGLAPGSYRARVRQCSIWSSEWSPMAEAWFRVRAGQRTEVTLREMGAIGEAESPLQLAFELSEDTSPARGERVLLQRRTAKGWSQGRQLYLASTWKTTAVPVPYGTFRVSVTGLHKFTLEFEHSAASEQPLRLQVPPLHHLKVRLTGDSDDAAVRRERVLWRSFGETEADGRVERVPSELGMFELFTERLPVEIALDDASRYELVGGPWLRLDVAGLHEVVGVDKARFRLRFLDDGKPVRVPIGMSVSVHAESGPGRAVRAPQERVSVGSSFPNELHVWFTSFGEQRITFGDLRGFEPIPGLAVDVQRGDDLVVELTLVRKR